jgi:hypothetical protein
MQMKKRLKVENRNRLKIHNNTDGEKKTNQLMRCLNLRTKVYSEFFIVLDAKHGD